MPVGVALPAVVTAWNRRLALVRASPCAGLGPSDVCGDQIRVIFEGVTAAPVSDLVQ